MNKLITALFSILFLASCSKTEMQQTTDTIKRADSLFQKADNGLKTLDSISKVFNDSSKLNTEIRRQTEKVTTIIKGSGNLDSLNSVLKKGADRITKGADAAKAVDSARKVIENSNDPYEILTTIGKTMEKISSKSNSSNTQPPQSDAQKSNKDTIFAQAPEVNSSPEVIADPMEKFGSITVEVSSLRDAENLLRMQVQQAEGQFEDQKEGEQAGEKMKTFILKIPMQSFDKTANAISQNIGNLRTKSMEQTGIQYDADRLCNLEVTLIQDMAKQADQSFNTIPTDSTALAENKQSTEETVGKIVMSTLPFLPIVLIIVVVWYFINRRNRRKKENTDLVMEKFTSEQSLHPNQPQTSESQYTPLQKKDQDFEDYQPKPKGEDNSSDDSDPYAKYKPKN